MPFNFTFDFPSCSFPAPLFHFTHGHPLTHSSSQLPNFARARRNVTCAPLPLLAIHDQRNEWPRFHTKHCSRIIIIIIQSRLYAIPRFRTNHTPLAAARAPPLFLLQLQLQPQRLLFGRSLNTLVVVNQYTHRPLPPLLPSSSWMWMDGWMASYQRLLLSRAE